MTINFQEVILPTLNFNEIRTFYIIFVRLFICVFRSHMSHNIESHIVMVCTIASIVLASFSLMFIYCNKLSRELADAE